MTPMRRGRRLAVDVGDARIGVASCDPHGILATPVENLPRPELPPPPPRQRAQLQ
ncbi:Holliday junction resolvase RuvX, partial [Streptomyces californicus]|uniref:Holliday junction resolvase RuvX n=1 Tax=Streptomyces californicus TaxID=67351 RepID=UPI0036BC6EB6